MPGSSLLIVKDGRKTDSRKRDRVSLFFGKQRLDLFITDSLGINKYTLDPVVFYQTFCTRGRDIGYT